MSKKLDASGEQIIDMTLIRVPATISLKTELGDIVLSFDNGATYDAVTYDIDTADKKVLSILSPVAAIKLTGLEGDEWFLYTQ